jgi:transcriptional regulator with XRE-family HTH domain
VAAAEEDDMQAQSHSSARSRTRQRTITADGPHPIDIHVGARIRAQRVLRGLTQSELAKLVGISFQSVQKYELGENRVSASRLYEFARALSVAPQHFFEGLEPRKPGGAGPGGAAREESDLRRHVAAVMAIEDERLRRLVIELLGVLSELGSAQPGGGARTLA